MMKSLTVIVMLLFLSGCSFRKNDSKRHQYLHDYVAYIKAHQIDTTICQNLFVDERIRLHEGRCDFFAYAALTLKEKISGGSGYSIETVTLTNARYDFDELLTNREVFYLKLSTPTSVDTVTFWIGDRGIKSCSMVIKGNRVAWWN